MADRLHFAECSASFLPNASAAASLCVQVLEVGDRSEQGQHQLKRLGPILPSYNLALGKSVNARTISQDTYT